MTTDECTKILAKYVALFPNFSASPEFFLALSEFFSEANADQFERALKRMIRNENLTFFPSASEIQRAVREVEIADFQAKEQRERHALLSLPTPIEQRPQRKPGWLYEMFCERRAELLQKGAKR